jgi:hypothetical protein
MVDLLPGPEQFQVAIPATRMIAVGLDMMMSGESVDAGNNEAGYPSYTFRSERSRASSIDIRTILYRASGHWV